MNTTFTREQIRPIKEAVELELLRRPGITGVDIDYKVVGGELRDHLAIVVFVKHKREVDPDQAIPSIIGGVPTDVVEAEFIALLDTATSVREGAAPPLPGVDPARYAALQGGISIGPAATNWSGTLGAIVAAGSLLTPTYYILSNYHVLASANPPPPNDLILQQSVLDGGTLLTDDVASYTTGLLNTQVDCALAQVDLNARALANPFNNIVGIGALTGVYGGLPPAPGTALRKRGRSTGLTNGTLASATWSGTITYAPYGIQITFQNQLRINGTAGMNAAGDSGALWIDTANNANRVAGLLFAGSTDGTMALANPIATVIAALAQQGVQIRFV